MKNRRDELKVRMERRKKEELMLGMSLQELQDAHELAQRERERLVLDYDKIKAYYEHQQAIKDEMTDEINQL